MIDLLGIPIWLEGRVALERAALMRDPVIRGEGIAHGDGAPVMLIAGFLAGDASLGPMAAWLRRIGYRPCRAGIRVNVDCSGRSSARLESELERHAERHGRRVTIIGQSRGGTMARALAVRRPDLVEAIVCLGSPIRDQLAVHPWVRMQIITLGLLGTLGVPGLFSRECATGECCGEVRRELEASFPEEVGFTSIYSRTDGIVDWHTCLDPAAEQVEVESSHVGMAVNAEVFKVVAGALAGRSRAVAVA